MVTLQDLGDLQVLITNDRDLSPAQVLAAHKAQPRIEKRFEQIKSLHEIAPVFLKNEARIEALFTLYFLALLVQAIIERQSRLAMQREGIDELPLNSESRSCRRLTTEQILRLFSLAERHILLAAASTVQVFEPDLSPYKSRSSNSSVSPSRITAPTTKPTASWPKIAGEYQQRCAECRAMRRVIPVRIGVQEIQDSWNFTQLCRIIGSMSITSGRNSLAFSEIDIVVGFYDAEFTKTTLTDIIPSNGTTELGNSNPFVVGVLYGAYVLMGIH